MGSEEEKRKLGFQTRLRIFQEREKPRREQDLGALEDWRAILEGLDSDIGGLVNLYRNTVTLNMCSMAIKLKSMQPQIMAYSGLLSALCISRCSRVECL